MHSLQNGAIPITLDDMLSKLDCWYVNILVVWNSQSISLSFFFGLKILIYLGSVHICLFLQISTYVSVLSCWYSALLSPKVFLLQAVLYKASAATYDILGCCLWCVVPGAPKSETWGDSHRVCREVKLLRFYVVISKFWQMHHSSVQTNFFCEFFRVMAWVTLNDLMQGQGHNICTGRSQKGSLGWIFKIFSS